MINQAYIHKKGPPKMIKDLKYGKQAQLSQSLIDYTQIQNLNKIFIGKKDHYKIPQQKPNQIHKNDVNQNQQDLQMEPLVFLSPQQNLQIIKKQRISNMMKDKLSSMFKEKQTRKYKMRKPILHNMLEQFKNSFRVVDPPKIKQALKNSQLNLSHIKINTRKRINSNYIRTQENNSRPKFISIKTSKPVITKTYFPNFQDFIAGKYIKNEQVFVGIDINKIDNYVTGLLQQPTRLTNLNRKNTLKTSYDWQIKGNNNHKSKLDDYQDFSQNLRFNKARAKSVANPNHTFTKSEQSSKKIINQMKTYYDSKKMKTKQCDQIVTFMKKDRPLTSNLRRKNYTLIGKNNLQDLTKYRQDAQHQRMKILKKNNNFYIGLLKMFQHCSVQQIPQTLKILRNLKHFFQSEYILMYQDIQKICNINKQQKYDYGVKIIKDNLLEYLQQQQKLITNFQEDYQTL